jgi:xanthine dehydrogenase YagR molybdenum-binding subunit
VYSPRYETRVPKNSRRDFLKTVGVGSVAASLWPSRSVLGQAATKGVADLPISLTVNGRRHVLTLDPRLTLLDVLRSHLDLTGTKRVCDRASCGACTVIVGGRTCYACALLAVDVQGADVRTVEGLADGTLAVIQERFCAQDAVMCGFCTPGCVMSAAALLETESAPTPEQAKRALDGNFCRCGANVSAGVLGAPSAPAAAPAPGALGALRAQRYTWPERPRVLGTRVRRIDGPAKATGRAKFTHDIARVGLLHARILRSPHAHARLLAIDLSAAQKAPGVRATMALLSPGQKAMFAGDEVAAVAAASELQALDAVRLIKVEWDVLPHLATVEQAMRPEAPNVFEPANTRTLAAQEAGDLDVGWRASAHVVEGLYSTQVQTHACAETHGCVCEWKGGLLTAWVSTQAVHATREAFATALNVPNANVRVMAEHVGGAFGSKLGPGVEGIVCARLARAASAPVKLVLDRKEEHLATGNRSSAFAQLRAGTTADGTLTAFEAQTWGTPGAAGSADFPLPYIYVFPHRRRIHTDVFINAGPQRPMRGSDHPQGCFITEVVMDELADAIRMDPLAFRMKNLPPAGPAAMWQRYFSIGAERIGWHRRHPTGDPSPTAVKRGLGCAAHRWRGSGQSARARCEIFPDGIVLLRCGTQDMGTGTRTLMAVVAAETLALPVEFIRVDVGDTVFPVSGPSVGSATAGAVSAAVRVVATMARDQLFDRIAPAAKGLAAAQALPWREACKLLGTQPVMAEAQSERTLSGAGSSGVQFAEVEVDIETGITRVVRITCVQDCGLIVDAQTAETQCHGGIMAGLNYALFEERILDRNTGHMVNPNLEFYRMAGQSDVPAIDIVLIDQPSRGVIGVGDPPTIATAAAIANAVRNAAGVTVRSLPITPEKLLGELERAGGTN